MCERVPRSLPSTCLPVYLVLHRSSLSLSGANNHGLFSLPRRRRATRLEHFLYAHTINSTVLCFRPARERKRRGKTYPDQPGAHLGSGLIFGKGVVGQQGRMTDDAGVGVAINVRLPLPTRRVRVAGADVLGLEPFEFLLGAKLVGLDRVVSTNRKQMENTITVDCIDYRGFLSYHFVLACC